MRQSKVHRGSSLLSTVAAVASFAVVGAAGYMTVSGNSICSLMGSCDTACTTDANADPAFNLVADNSAGTAKSCCSLGAVAGKSSCSSAQPATLMASAETSSCSTAKASSCCSSKGATTETVAAKTSCSSGEVLAASTKSSSCCASKAKPAAQLVKAKTSLNGKDISQLPTVLTRANSTPSALGIAAPSNTPSANGINRNAPTTKTEGCCSGKDKAKAVDHGSIASNDMTIQLLSPSNPFIMPAAFFTPAELAPANLTDTGCCRSKVENASTTSQCAEAKTCCSKGEPVASAN